MKKIIYPVILLTLLSLASCKSKKNMVSTLPSPVLNTDSVHADTAATVPADVFAPDHAGLKELDVSKEKKSEPAKKQTIAGTESADRVLREAKITSSTESVSSAYTGVDRVVKYDFTHRDVPEAFEGFRIAFVSDLHYKSLLKEQGLNNLVRLLIAQKADVLLMGGDYQEGCEYVEPLFAALSRVKTPMGTYGVMGNNDYERCHDEIVRTMKHYGMRVLEHEVDTLRKDGQQIIIAGVRNPFDLTHNGVSPTLALSPKDFVILLVHTPCSGRAYPRRTSPCLWSRPGVKFSLREPLLNRAGLQHRKNSPYYNKRNRHFTTPDSHWCTGRSGNDNASSVGGVVL